LCSRLKMWTSSWRRTRPQLNGLRMPLPCGDTMANILPVQAPMVCRSGSATTRPLNISWLLKISQDRVLDLVADLLRQVGVEGLQVLRHVIRQRLVLLGVEAHHEVLGLERLVGVEVLEDLAAVGDADVERVGLEGLVEDSAGLLLATHAHVEHA